MKPITQKQLDEAKYEILKNLGDAVQQVGQDNFTQVKDSTNHAFQIAMQLITCEVIEPVECKHCNNLINPQDNYCGHCGVEKV